MRTTGIPIYGFLAEKERQAKIVAFPAKAAA